MYVENMVYIASIKRKERNRSRRSYIDTGRNINPLLWSEYKVYKVKKCGYIELDIQ